MTEEELRAGRQEEFPSDDDKSAAAAAAASAAAAAAATSISSSIFSIAGALTARQLIKSVMNLVSA
jgi:hypothetical protein